MSAPSSQTVLHVLASDHASILELLDVLEQRVAGALMAGGRAEAEDLREQLVIEVVRHLTAEEQYLWPVVRQRLADGEALSEVARSASRECEDALCGLERPDADADYLTVALATARRLLTEHVSAQQDELFPILRQQLGDEELLDLAEQVRGAEQVAPTSPRTLAPANPTLNKMTGLVEGFVDRVRDSYTHRGADEDNVG